MNAIVTGGAGFVGSYLTERLLKKGHDVTVVDSLLNGQKKWVPHDANFVQANLMEKSTIGDIVNETHDVVFHLASRKAVNSDDPWGQFQENTKMARQVALAAGDAGVKKFVFTSSSTVYGEAPQPTPEDYAPLEPISAYGASKLANEGSLSTIAHSHGLTLHNVRFANIVGPRLRSAVIPDFIEKLRTNKSTLTILGNGRQKKSYMHVSDCVDAMLYILESAEEPIATFNVGTRTTTSVNRIADIVSEEMGVDPKYEYTGGDRGWTGDVPKMRLSIEKLSALGWEPKLESESAVRTATIELIREFENG